MIQESTQKSAILHRPKPPFINYAFERRDEKDTEFSSATTDYIDVIITSFSTNQKDFIPNVRVWWRELHIIDFYHLLEKLRQLGFYLDEKIISYYSPKRNAYVYYGETPLPYDAIIPEEELIQIEDRFQIEIGLREQLSNQQLIHRPTEQSRSLIQAGNEENQEVGVRRIGDILGLDKLCAKPYERSVDAHIAEKEALDKLTGSDTTLDEDLALLRDANRFGFDFQKHEDDPLALLEQFVNKQRGLEALGHFLEDKESNNSAEEYHIGKAPPSSWKEEPFSLTAQAKGRREELSISQQTNEKGTGQPYRRIGEICKLVESWRKICDGNVNEKTCKPERVSGKEAATIVGIPYKTLGKYFGLTRDAKRFGFDFQKHCNEQLKVLTKFVEKHRRNEEILKEIENSTSRQKVKSVLPSMLLSKEIDAIETAQNGIKNKKNGKEIGEVVKLVESWRKSCEKSFDEKTHKFIGITGKEAAGRIGIPCKTLKTYFGLIKAAERYGFDFKKHYNDPWGMLRKYVEKERELDASKKYYEKDGLGISQEENRSNQVAGEAALCLPSFTSNFATIIKIE